MKDRNLLGEVVVTTDSARGIGAATARAFAAEGAKVVISKTEPSERSPLMKVLVDDSKCVGHDDRGVTR